MKENTLKMCIVSGICLVLVFPILAFASFFFTNEVAKNTDIYLEENNNKSIIETIGKNSNAKVDLNTIMLQNNEEVIEDNNVPLAGPKGKIVTGKTVKADFKSHEKEIEEGTLVFEVILQNDKGSDMLFTTYDELEFIVNDKSKYEKQFLLKDNKLIRYTYLEQK